MIDTSLLIDYFRKTNKQNTRLVQMSERYEQLAISSITQFEIYTGARSDQKPYWEQLLSEMLVYSFDGICAHIAVELQRKLKLQRKCIDMADLFIAAIAVANSLPFDTLNIRHFDKIDTLILAE